MLRLPLRQLDVYPLDPMPPIFRAIARANPITWHVDVLRYATIGSGHPALIAAEGPAFLVFTVVAFACALRVLQRQE